MAQRIVSLPAFRALRQNGVITRACRPSTTAGVAVRFASTSAGSEQPPDAATVIQGPSLLTNTSVHRPSPSLFHLPGLRSLPFWTAPPSSKSSRNRIAYNDPTISAIVDKLEASYDDIKAEYMSAVLGTGTGTDLDTPNLSSADIKPLEPDYDVNVRGGEHATDALHTGTWDWHSYVLNGEPQPKFADRCPKTAALVDGLLEEGLLFETPFSFCFFSTLQGKSSIKAHVGPMNLRLRIHLPLIVPDESRPLEGASSSDSNAISCGLRVGSQVRRWEEGRALVLDDSYEHEVWNDTSGVRVLLLLDVWHPDVTRAERDQIRKMFDYAKDKGWIGKEDAIE